MQAAKARTEPSGGIADGEDVASKVDVPGPPPSVLAPPVEVPTEVVTAAPALPTPPRRDKEEIDDVRVAGMRVPATAATVMEWASLWVRMCADGESVMGPLNDDDARARYGVTAKQLRNVRKAATSGALRQKAIMLVVQLPPGYVDNPAGDRVDGRDMAGTAA